MGYMELSFGSGYVELSCEVLLKEVMSEGVGRYHTTTGTQDVTLVARELFI
jgi:hypothetical protein